MSDRAVSPQDGREKRNQFLVFTVQEKNEKWAVENKRKTSSDPERRRGEWTQVKWERAGWRGHKHIERASKKKINQAQ
ncbi:hypothetical protein AOLI_G00113160 [Acnodon oligacanthus]